MKRLQKFYEFFGQNKTSNIQNESCRDYMQKSLTRIFHEFYEKCDLIFIT